MKPTYFYGSIVTHFLGDLASGWQLNSEFKTILNCLGYYGLLTVGNLSFKRSVF